MRISAFLLTVVALLVLSSCGKTSDQDSKDDNQLTYQDPHSFADPDGAYITHLSWEADVDFKNRIINGVARYTIENPDGAKSIIFDTRDLTIEKVTTGLQNETKAEHDLGQEEKYLGRALEVQIPADAQYVNIYYQTDPAAEAVQWLSPQQTAGKEYPFLFTQSQAILARTWIPIQDSPGIRFTYDATVRVPQDLLALMSASNPQQKNNTGEYHFEMEQPIPAYLMALAVGDLAFQPIDPQTGVYAEPGVVEDAAWEFDNMDEMLQSAEELYGQYRWDRYDVIVLPPSFPFGGMENPRLTFATPTILAGDRSLTSLIAHELAHSWSGNLVTNATWDDFWLNEGFTTYFEKRIMEKLYGEGYAKMLWNLAYQDLQEEMADLREDDKWDDTKLKLNLAGRNPDDGMTDIAYDKGSLFLLHVEHVVGRQRFDKFLSKYFNDNAFETMTTARFVDYLDEHLIKGDTSLGRKINAQGWIYEPGLPGDHPVVTTERFAQVEGAIDQWQAGTSAAALQTSEWTTHEWLHFLRNLPANLDKQKMAELDDAFKFTQSGNSEITALWLKLAIEQKYEQAYPRLREFLTQVGRRKFLEPLYRALAKSEAGLEMARDIYADARPNYHAVSFHTIDDILNMDKRQ
jgi:leukotriene A-4 hydrolase/aminopeptidase